MDNITLFAELYTKLLSNNHDNLSLLDEVQYYNIWTVTEYANGLLSFIANFCIKNNLLLHIALTRKIDIRNDNIILYLLLNLNTRGIIDQFFSFYSTIDIKKLLVRNFHGRIMSYEHKSNYI